MYSDHLCRAENDFIILFVYDKMCEQNVIVFSAVTELNTAFYILLFHIFFLRILAIVIMFTVIFHCYIPRQNRKYITIVLSCSLCIESFIKRVLVGILLLG